MDFSSLSQLKNGARKRFLGWVIATLCVGCFGLLVVIGDASSLPFMAVITLLPAGISVWAYYGLRKERSYNDSLLSQFANANQWRFTPEKDARSFPLGSGALFRDGHSPVVRYLLEGTASDLPASLFGYDYVTGSGRQRQTHRTTVMRLTLPRVLPQMVIDSLVEGGSNNSSVLPISFDSSQRIELEGEFSRYFACYAPSGYGVSLLTVVGPDAMLTLMKYAAACDIEIVDNYIYFYWPARASTREGYEHMYATVDAVMKEIGHKLTKSDIYKTPEQASLHSTTQAEGVRLVDPKLSPFVLVLSFVVMGGIVAGFSWLRYKHPAALAASIPLILVISILLSIVARQNAKHKREDLRKRFQ